MTLRREFAMGLHMNSLGIEGFRAINQLTLSGLDRVNLLTGRNNSGKSTVLEALRILASGADPAILLNILRFREEILGGLDDDLSSGGMENLYQVSSLFLGFPRLSDNPKPIKICSQENNAQKHEISLEVGWWEENSEGYTKTSVPGRPNGFDEDNSFPALTIGTELGSRTVRLDKVFDRSERRYFGKLHEKANFPCEYINAYGGERTATLGTLWDRIALSDREHDVVEALQIIDSSITGVSMVGSLGSNSTRAAIVKSSNFSKPVPLRSFGDGLNRLFGIILSLVNAKDGILLIDEYENGIHHAVQLDMWKAIFKLARKLNVQVFATSHSWDAIKAFQKAVVDTPEDGVLIRLTRNGGDLIPTRFGEQELTIATRDNIEVR